MKKPVLLLLLCLLLLASACRQEKTDVSKDVLFVELENKIKDQDETAYLSKAVKKLTYIPLETDTNCLVSNIRKIVFYNNTILISDFNRVFQFSSTGKFMGMVGRKGEGPSDYRQASVLAKNEKEDRLYLVGPKKINIYDEKLSFINAVSFGDDGMFIPPMSGVMTSNEHLLLYIGGLGKAPGDTTTMYSYIELDTQGNTIRKIPNTTPIVSEPISMRTNYNLPLYRYGGKVNYMDDGNDTLFTITSNGISLPYAIFHLGTQKRDIHTTPRTPQEAEAYTSYPLISSLLEKDDLFYLSFSWKQKTHRVIYDKQTEQLTNLGIDGLTNDIDGGPPFFPRAKDANGTLISWVEAEAFREHILSQDYQTQKAKYGQAFEDAWTLANKLEEDDNPVLLIAR